MKNFNIFCNITIVFIFFIFLVKFCLLFFPIVVKYTCKSVAETELKNAHHFPPYHIGNRLGVARFQGGYRLFIFVSFLDKLRSLLGKRNRSNAVFEAIHHKSVFQKVSAIVLHVCGQRVARHVSKRVVCRFYVLD